MDQIEKIIDIAIWNRREHYEHFSVFDDPFFGVIVQVDCTRTYQETKIKDISFSLLVLHQITTAAAAVEEFRYRIEDDRMVCYDSLLPEATVGRDDHTFSFAIFEYDPDGLIFIHRAGAKVERLRATTGLNEGSTFHPNAIHCSAMSWPSFTDMKYSTNIRSGDNVPKVSTGKYLRDGEGLMMPVSVTYHHGLMDGYHVAQFIEKLHL